MKQATGIGINRFFTKPGSKAQSSVAWKNFVISNPKNQQSAKVQVEFPDSWSVEAVNAAYVNFRGYEKTKETSFKQIVDRVVDAISKSGQQQGYFETDAETEDFREEMKFVIYHQKASFDTPIMRQTSTFIGKTFTFTNHPSDDQLVINMSTEQLNKISKDSQARQEFGNQLKADSVLLRFDHIINKWNTCPGAGQLLSPKTSPECLLPEGTASSLSVINLLHFLDGNTRFEIEAFTQTVKLLVAAQEILINASSYENEDLTQKTRSFRPIGLSMTGLGALLTSQGVGYDSDEALAKAAVITALMTGSAYAASARMARQAGPFAGFHMDRQNVLKVINQHRQIVSLIDASYVPEELLNSAVSAWDEAVSLSELYGIRNCQMTLISESHTLDQILDSVSSGIWAFYAGKHGSLKSQEKILDSLGYSKKQQQSITKLIEQGTSFKVIKSLKKEHVNLLGQVPTLKRLYIFGAVQSFLSGSLVSEFDISGMSIEETVDLVSDAQSSGLKQITLTRKNSTTKEEPRQKISASINPISGTSQKQRYRELPSLRKSQTFSFRVAATEVSATVGMYDDGTPAELFINLAKQDLVLSGALSALASSISQGLQYGVPLKNYIKDLTGVSFEPTGETNDSDVQTTTSIIDYIARKLALLYLTYDERLELGIDSNDSKDSQTNLPI